MLYSFDVFDTIITRNTATPDGIFALMQYDLKYDSKYIHLDEYIKNNFYVLRGNAERLARENFYKRGIEEITLNQIYICMATTGLISSNDIDLLMELELELEQENIIGIKSNIDRIHNLLKEGKQVILLSDMYLSSRQIRKLLAKVDKRLSELEIIVSSDVGVSKRLGSLYSYVQNKYGIAYDLWQHYGDNMQSDVIIPMKYGIVARRYLYPDLTDGENILIKNNKTDIFMQLSIGNSRNCRIKHGITDQAWLVGNSSIAPILVTYVQWILNCAKQQHINRLYFIARDGYVLKKIADELISIYGYNIATKYIYGSRKAWRMPSFSGDIEELRKIIAFADFSKCFTIGKIAKILGISEFVLKNFLPIKYRHCEVSSRICFSDLKELCCNEAFRMYLLDLYENKKILANKYLLQELDLHDGQWAFVELHGSGFTIACLCNLLKKNYSGKIRAFYLSMDKVGACGDSVLHNLLSLQLPYKYMTELFCRAPHGQTIGYEREGDKIVPIIESHNDTNWIDGEYDKYVGGVMDYVKDLSNFSSRYLYYNNLELLEAYFNNIIEGKDSDVMDYFGEIFSSASNENKFAKKYAPKLLKKDIRNIFLWNDYDSYSGLELSLSVLRCTEKEKTKIEYYKKNRKQIVKRYVSLFNLKSIKSITNNYSHIFSRLYWQRFAGNIIVYGAGKFGKAFYKKAQEKGINIIAWLDKNYIDMGLNGDENYLVNHMFECVFIAILDSFVAQSVKERFIELGVDVDKILLLNDVIESDLYFDI